MTGRKAKRKKIVIGVTGSLGTGKTTVSRYFGVLGAKVIDADKIAHRLLKPPSCVYKKIIRIFGSRILKKDKSIDRNKLSQIVFNSSLELKKLNKIIHPEVVRAIKKGISRSAKKAVVLDVPLFFEAGLEPLADKIIVVKTSRVKQLKRLLKKTSLTRQELFKRINSQIPLYDKVRLADFIIDNSGSLRKTKGQVKSLRRILWKN